MQNVLPCTPPKLTDISFRLKASYFFLLSQAKVAKKKATLCRLLPALLVPVGGNRTRPSGLHKQQATAELKQAIAETSHLHCAARRDRKGGVAKPSPQGRISLRNPPHEISLSAQYVALLMPY